MIWNLPVQTIDLGLSEVDVFVGYTDPESSVLASAAANGELTEQELEDAGAIGLFLDEVSLGMVLGSALPVAPVDLGTGTLNAAFLKFFALKVDALTVALLGVPELDLRADNLQVRVNQGSFVPGAWPVAPGLFPPPVIDFRQSFPDDSWDASNPDSDSDADGYQVQTSTTNSAPVVLLFEQPVVGASADRVLLRVSDFVYVSGSFSFNKGPVREVDVRTNLNQTQALPVLGALMAAGASETDPGAGTIAAKGDGSMIWNLPVQTIDLGLSEVDVFVGYTDPESSVLASAAANGELTEQELEDAGAIGLFLDEVSLGMVLGSTLPVAPVTWGREH